MIMLDDNIIETFRREAERRGIGYQTAINQALRQLIDDDRAPLTEERLRAVIREELGAG